MAGICGGLMALGGVWLKANDMEIHGSTRLREKFALHLSTISSYYD